MACIAGANPDDPGLGGKQAKLILSFDYEFTYILRSPVWFSFTQAQAYHLRYLLPLEAGAVVAVFLFLNFLFPRLPAVPAARANGYLY